MPKIKVYSQPTCSACNEMKEYLKKRGVEFDEIDITTNREALNEMIKVHKVRVTPLLIMGDRKLVGFDPVAIDKLLEEGGK
ncbi:MAG TPA: glutaredoxin domain-containing protein [Methanocella sp.]|nr:glutaredoxin domain-containing protein [Methanocella sp.]